MAHSNLNTKLNNTETRTICWSVRLSSFDGVDRKKKTEKKIRIRVSLIYTESPLLMRFFFRTFHSFFVHCPLSIVIKVPLFGYCYISVSMNFDSLKHHLALSFVWETRHDHRISATWVVNPLFINKFFSFLSYIFCWHFPLFFLSQLRDFPSMFLFKFWIIYGDVNKKWWW